MLSFSQLPVSKHYKPCSMIKLKIYRNNYDTTLLIGSQAQYLIFEKMREEGFVAGTEDVRLTIEILVPSTQVGRIIGKGGQNVRELQRVTGSIIKLSEQQSTSPSADEEATVQIIGPFFSVQVFWRVSLLSFLPFEVSIVANETRNRFARFLSDSHSRRREEFALWSYSHPAHLEQV